MLVITPNLLHVLLVDEPGLVRDLFVDGVWVAEMAGTQSVSMWDSLLCLLQGGTKAFNFQVQEAGWP